MKEWDDDLDGGEDYSMEELVVVNEAWERVFGYDASTSINEGDNVSQYIWLTLH